MDDFSVDDNPDDWDQDRWSMDDVDPSHRDLQYDEYRDEESNEEQ